MKRETHAFTILELLIVMSVIVILSGLVLTTSRFVQEKGARSRVEAEIVAISVALENYKADNGIYPITASTDRLKPNSAGDPTQSDYQDASLDLYKELSGDHDANRTVNASDDSTGNGVVPKTYFAFKPINLLPAPPSRASAIAIRDPFGNSYGYSTAKASNSNGSDGHNPTFDLWSTAGTVNASATPDQSRWIKNW